MSETAAPKKPGKVARLRKRFSESLGRLACKFHLAAICHAYPNSLGFFAAIAKEDWSMSRTRSQTRLAALHRNKEKHRLNGKSGFSEEFLDRLDGSDGGESGTGGDGRASEPDMKWERLRLSDGDLLTASRDPEFEKLKGSGGADSGLGSDEPAQASSDQAEQPVVVLRRPKKSASAQRPKSEMYPSSRGLDSTPIGLTPSGPSVGNLKPSESIRRSKRYSAFGGTSPFGKVENYLRLEQLGEGSYATVYRGFSK